MNKKYLETAIKFLIYASFFVPLLVFPQSFIFPFIVPKILALRSLIILMLGAYALLLIINWREYRPKFTPLNVVLTAFLLSFAVSTFVGVDPYHSFWDNHERMLGLFTIFHYLAFYFVCSAVFKDWKDWRAALRLFLLAGSVVMFIGFLQTQFPDLLLNREGERVASTLGNSIYVSGYGVFLFFAALLLFFKDKSAPLWRWLYGAAALLALLGLFFGGSRGALLGWMIGVGCLLLGYAIILKEKPRARLALLAVIILSVLTVVGLYGARGSALVKDIPALNRVFSTSWQEVRESPRWIAWGVAIQSWKERPVFGWGPNNYFYAFNQYYNPRLLDFGFGETWFDNAHNIIVNTLAVQGALGLLIYLSIFFVSFVLLYQGFRRGRADRHLLVVGAAFLIAHLFKNITVFEDPTSYLYFMFWLAFINVSAGADAARAPAASALGPNQAPYRLDRRAGGGVVALISVVALALIFVFNFQPARANMMTLQAIKDLTQNPTSGLDSARVALAFSSPHIDDIRSDIARTISQFLPNAYSQLGKDKGNEFFDVAYGELKKNISLHPLDIRNHLILAQLAHTRAYAEQSATYIYEGATWLRDALSKSPRRQQILYSLSNYEFQLGRPADAFAMLEQTVADNPRVSEGYWRLAYLYQLSGDNTRALQTIERARAAGVRFTSEEEQYIAQIINSANAQPAP